MANTTAARPSRKGTLVYRRSAAAPAKKPKVASLEEVLAYKNRDVVQRFLKSYPIDPSDAEEIFTEMKRWLYGTAGDALALQKPCAAKSLIIVEKKKAT